MFSQYCVILLCISSIYCISSKIETLNVRRLSQVLNGETPIKEWETAMDQEILYDGNIVNVRQAVAEYKQKFDDDDDVSDFRKTRDIIKIGYQCTLMKYASLTSYMMIMDVRTLKSNISIALLRMRASPPDPQTLFDNETFKDHFQDTSGDKYNVDFDIRFLGRKIQLLSKHKFDETPWREWHNVWEKMIWKNLGFNLKYKIYPDIIKEKFTNQLNIPEVKILNEIACVLNEQIQLFDKFVVENCVPRQGRFINKYRTLKNGVGDDVIGLALDIDKHIFRGSSYHALFRDYSLPVPGTSAAANNLMGSGGFVEKVEVEISGLKMNVTNTKNPTDIYGHHDNERTSEPVLRFRRSVPKSCHVVDVGMVKFMERESWLEEESRPIGLGIAATDDYNPNTTVVTYMVFKNMTLVFDLFNSILKLNSK